MFKRAKKKQEKETALVDYLIQLYAEQSTVDGRLLEFISEQARSEEERHELLASLDRYNTLLNDTPMFDSFKKQLFGADKNLLILSHLELSVCFLASTTHYYPEAIADMLWIDRERLVQVVRLLEQKLAKAGYGLPKGYKTMQPLLHEYCSKVLIEKQQ